MAQANSSNHSRKASARSKPSTPRKSRSGSGARNSGGGRGARSSAQTASAKRSAQASASRSPRSGEGLTGLAEQLANRILKPLGLIVLSKERIAETLEEAAERGRLTHSDAERLASELVQRGRQQTEELLSELDGTLGRARQPLDVATRRARKAAPDRLVRGADRARRTIGVGPAFPIIGYDELTVGQVQTRLPHLSDPELRTVRDYERRHGNRKSLLAAIEKALGSREPN